MSEASPSDYIEQIKHLLKGGKDSVNPLIIALPLVFVILSVALAYFGRRHLIKRRSGSQDEEANPPLYQSNPEYQVSDIKSKDVSTIATPAAAMVRGENYFIVTPRHRTGSMASLGSHNPPRSRSNSDSPSEVQPPAYVQ
ncbi:MAG: hypothetical protein J3Q66DRAFT_367337 [Benniella sp.]|nr:MAG: hypothetical protein J3Q66DRAFT_367337 [Benniella sp.]